MTIALHAPTVRQPWIHSAAIDGTFILGPALLATAVALLIVLDGQPQAGLGLWSWALLVIGIDVAHVYSTVYRTYFDPLERAHLSGWLIAVPITTWVAGVLLYSMSAASFWTVLAYTAVFHFVRQQYGFLMLYARAERSLPVWCRRLDQISIYGATLFPLLYWHTHLPRQFVWFIDGDFLPLPDILWSIALPPYVALCLAYLAKEAWLRLRAQPFNIPRNAIVLGTGLSWFFGIVITNGDLVFTLTNVVAHGVPYLALTCIYQRRRDQQLQRPWSLFTLRLLPFAIGLLVLFAFIEEGFWDALVWREHLALFPGFRLLPEIQGIGALSLLVPLLAVPQMTHYVIDGLIWRLRAHPEWRTTLFGRPGAKVHAT
ncbi:MAG TPA: hypothetical protein VNZ06_14795 [Steroidobacteraceae bacterium]|jgi:hypothetical protein|nr:hypothetical protein [Steroidobacteraceae bacterium]